ncbi:MAG TPA: thioredoxin family protein [Methanospirillum sp.]|nr:thioredoxin family protein [Methanospirillum sp.]
MSDPSMIDIKENQWEQEIEKSSQPTFVMFYSPACRHCIQMQPYVEKLADEFSESVKFFRVDVSQSGWLSERYGIMATPTFGYFCGGKPVQTLVGAVFPAMLKKMIDEMIEHGQECQSRSTELLYEVTGYG